MFLFACTKASDEQQIKLKFLTFRCDAKIYTLCLSQLSIQIFTVRNSSCGKVMFSQTCVKNSVHEEGGGGLSASGSGGCTPPGQTPPHPQDGHCSRRYASYWNAFLLVVRLLKQRATYLIWLTCFRV